MKQNDQVRMRVCEGEVQETLDICEARIEDLMLGMRMSRGVSRDQVEMVEASIPGTLATFQELEANDYVFEEQARFKPTQKGWLWGNVLYGTILDLAAQHER